MRNAFAFFLIPVLLAGTAAAVAAQTPVPGPSPLVEEDRQPVDDEQARLDDLFTDLKRERNEKAAERIARQIGAEWMQSGSASVDLMMQWVDKAIEEEKYDIALDFLDQVIVLQPGFAEGWNRRATVHFLMENYAKAMADIDHTLRLEPRHFGALAGMAGILKAAGLNERALDAYQRALDVYPMLRDAQSELAELAEELAGEGI